MIGIKINNEWLNLDKGSNFIYTANSPLFLAGEMDKILTSFTSEFKITMTPANKKILGYPEAIDNYASLMTDAECDLYYLGFYLFSGLLSVIEISNKEISVKIVINPYKPIKETSLRDVVNDTFYFVSVDEIKLHAKTTLNDPAHYNHCFFPIWNENWLLVQSGNTTYPFGAYQNHYVGNAFPDVSGKAAMPFVKLKYILEKIAESMQFEIDNQFQNIPELEALYLYNNFSIYKDEEWGTEFSYSNHVGDLTATEFFKNVVKTFCLAAIPDFIERKLLIKPVNEILDSRDVVDWSDYALEDYTLQSDINIPSKIGFEKDAYDPDGEREYYYREIYTEVDKFSEIGAGDGIYYVRSTAEYWEKLNGIVKKIKKQHNRHYIAANNNEMYNLPISPLYQASFFPLCRYKGIIQNDEENAGQNPGMHLIFYRGMVSAAGSSTYPYANCSNYNEDGSVGEEYEYSLDLTGEKGLYEKFWKNWLHFMLHRKIVTRKFVVPFQKFLEFSFEKKIKVGNMYYFCNNIKAAFSSGHMIEIEAEMSSIISS